MNVRVIAPRIISNATQVAVSPITIVVMDSLNVPIYPMTGIALI